VSPERCDISELQSRCDVPRKCVIKSCWPSSRFSIHPEPRKETVCVLVIQVKVKSFCLLMHHTVKAYGVVKVWPHILLTSALDGGELSASRPRERTLGTLLIGACKFFRELN
jgi:hypothetical protein